MKIAVISSVAGIVGYIAGVALGMLVVNYFSSNTHDKSVEATMSSFLIYGPVMALLSFASTLIYFLIRRNR